MARADSAHAPVRAGAGRGLACTATQPALLRLARREIWVGRAVRATVALFAGALVAITVVMTREAYDRAVTDAFTDIELTAGIRLNISWSSRKRAPQFEQRYSV